MPGKPNQAPEPDYAAGREVTPEEDGRQAGEPDTPDGSSAETAPGDDTAAEPDEQPAGEPDQPAAAPEAPEPGPPPAAQSTPLPPMQPVQGAPVPMAPMAQLPMPAGTPYPPPHPPYAPPQPFAPPPPLFDAFWPRPGVSGAPVALLAAVIGGAAAAIFVPLGGPGIGWPLLGLTIAAGMVLVGRKAERKVHIGQVCWAVVALLLLSVCAFRSADWLTAWCVLTAGVAGVLAVTGGRSVRTFGLAAIAIPVAALRALPWAVRGMRERGRGSVGLRLVASLAVTVLLLLIFGALFAGADENFAALASAVLPRLDGESFFRWTFVLVVFGASTLGAAFTLLRPPEPAETTREVKTLRRLEWALPIGVLVVLFAAFIAVQSTPMFGGEQHVQHTEQLTYAGYARSGFWQLTFVTILTLPIIGAAARWAPKSTQFDRNLLRGLGGALAVLTLLIVFSALIRMWAYQDAYGYTVMRLLVMSCELWLGVVYLLVIAAGARLRAGWLPAAVVGTAMAALLGLAALNPDAFIAERNIARFEATGKLDQEYLERLSADALPALQGLPEEARGPVVAEITEDLFDEGWRSWNLSDHLARTGP
ncbi:DUF4173 domain-containing protein [Saccharopolyspora sp. NPDC050642]|uniref:DUF4153 domain-containing protein n=1 Tax=Saccharopolyspora sp. NPDC050642 TaxID=3157099 RepID=UPI00340B022C